MARKTRDYSDFINYLKSNPEKNRTQAIEGFRKSGGHISKKKGLEIARHVMGDIQKGASRNEHISKHVTSPPEIKANRYVKINGKVERDRSSPAIELLQKHINKLMGTKKQDKFLKVSMKVNGDDLSQKKNAYFGVMIPIEQERKRLGAKTFAKTLYKNISTYYSNLAKKYRRNKEKNEMVNEVLSNLEMLKQELNGITNDEILKQTFTKYGFEITDINYFFITNDAEQDY